MNSEDGRIKKMSIEGWDSIDPAKYLVCWIVSESWLLEIGDNFEDDSNSPNTPANVILQINKFGRLYKLNLNMLLNKRN